MVKGEISHHEPFLLFPQCFQKASAANVSECVCKWERVEIYCVDSVGTLSMDEQLLNEVEKHFGKKNVLKS